MPFWRQNVTISADVYCSQGAQKPALSATASPKPPNLDKIAEGDDFTFITTKNDTR
jgi:hypothetical protein